ncbi:glycosyltransferase family 4 protein [uncultured Methylobacterium sp.]|uniref:glycosyltransferase family 4 protein n=1 Tax=uncultured Methylobacterium sp. TaxID=157278 RepID=UPI0035C9D2FA
MRGRRRPEPGEPEGGSIAKLLLPTLYDTRGGSTRVLLAAADALRREHAVTVRAPLAEADEATPARFPSRPLAGTVAKLALLPRLARLVVAETLALRRLRPDLIHVHDEPSLYVYGVAARLVRPRPTVLWHLHAGAGRGWAARLRARLADACIVISPHVAQPAGLPCWLVRNPLGPPGPARPPAAPGVPGIAVIGALGLRKGQDVAVEALAVLRQLPGGETARLTLIGPALDAAFARTLRARIAVLGLDQAVTFAGERAPDRAFDGVGLVLCPSRSETQPLALAEALARGLPVVASDIPAHRAMLADAGGNGDDLCPLDAHACAHALLTAAQRPPPPERAARIQTLFEQDRFDRALRDVLGSLAAQCPRSRL